MDKRPLLQVIGLTTYFMTFGGKRVVKAVDKVSFEVQQGGRLALIGESGCGKSTVALSLLRVLPPAGRILEGEILFEGRNVYTFRRLELKAYRCKVQAVFQDPFASLSPRLKIKDIIAEPLEVSGGLSKRELESRVAEVLRMAGLDSGLMKIFPHELSGGQRQRVAIARSISTHSKFIILDEPTSALDVSVRLQIVHLLLELHEKLQNSYLLIGHDLAMVAYMSTDIAVMYLGKIVEIAETKELLRNTVHPYTQALISASLPHHPRDKKERTVLSGEIASPLNVPPGCRFHPRCVLRKPICSEQEPPLAPVGQNHRVACHLI